MPITVRNELFDPELVRLSGLSAALAHPARQMILRVLARRESCICGQIVDELPLSQASVSRNLKAMNKAGLVRGEIDGPRSCYCLDRTALAALRKAMAGYFEALPEHPQPPTCSH